MNLIVTGKTCVCIVSQLKSWLRPLFATTVRFTNGTPSMRGKRLPEKQVLRSQKERECTGLFCTMIPQKTILEMENFERTFQHGTFSNDIIIAPKALFDRCQITKSVPEKPAALDI